MLRIEFRNWLVLYCKIHQKSYSYQGGVSYCRIQHQMHFPDARFASNLEMRWFCTVKYSTKKAIRIRGVFCIAKHSTTCISLMHVSHRMWCYTKSPISRSARKGQIGPEGPDRSRLAPEAPDWPRLLSGGPDWPRLVPGGSGIATTATTTTIAFRCLIYCAYRTCHTYVLLAVEETKGGERPGCEKKARCKGRRETRQ